MRKYKQRLTRQESDDDDVRLRVGEAANKRRVLGSRKPSGTRVEGADWLVGWFACTVWTRQWAEHASGSGRFDAALSVPRVAVSASGNYGIGGRSYITIYPPLEGTG